MPDRCLARVAECGGHTRYSIFLSSCTLTVSTNVDQKKLETEFLIDICRPTGDKWQSKTLFLATFDSCSSIIKRIFDCGQSGVDMEIKSISGVTSKCHLQYA